MLLLGAVAIAAAHPATAAGASPSAFARNRKGSVI